MQSYLDFYLETAQRETSSLPTLRELEKEYLRYLLEFTRFNISQVARILDISRTSVYQMITRHGIPRPN
jgi:transcriptional regulator of acetoin/glycerol metabolism